MIEREREGGGRERERGGQRERERGGVERESAFLAFAWPFHFIISPPKSFDQSKSRLNILS